MEKDSGLRSWEPWLVRCRICCGVYDLCAWYNKIVFLEFSMLLGCAKLRHGTFGLRHAVFDGIYTGMFVEIQSVTPYQQ